MEKKLEDLGKDITSVQSKLDESLTTLRSAIASHYDGVQSMLNSLVNDPDHVLMDDDDDIDISGDNETIRDRCLLCIARAKQKTLRESNEAYSKWVAHQGHKKVAKTTRVNNDQLREQISKVVDSTYEPSKADTCTKREELLRVHEQVSLLRKAVSKLIVDFSKSSDKPTNKPTKNGPRRRGRSFSAARKNPCSHIPNNGTKNHDRARSGSLPKTTPQAKAEGKRKRRTSGKNGPSRKERKRQWRRSKRLNECLGKASRLRGHEPDFEIPTLQGDVHLVPPPSILVDVLKHGGKYVPFPTLHPFVAGSSKMLRKDVDELEWVLIWSTHFVSKKTQDTSKRPSLLEFPYKNFFASTGSRPSYTISECLFFFD